MKLRAFIVALLSGLGLTGLAVQAAPTSSLKVEVVDQRGVPVSDAVVEVRGARGHSGSIRFPWRMAMAQKNLEFTPGTLIVAQGSTVAFPNLDRVRHSIYSFSKPARFEIELYGRDQTRTQKFPRSGTVALGCNIHDSMRGYIRVTDTPYAMKADRNGVVRLSSLPSGSAEITVWHPRLRAPGGEATQQVRLSGGAQTSRVQVRLR